MSRKPKALSISAPDKIAPSVKPESANASRRYVPSEPRNPRQLDLSQKGGFYSALGYHSAYVTYREGRTPTPGSGEYHARFHRWVLQNQSREFDRDNSIYQGMIDRAVNYIVSHGFGLQARMKGPNANNVMERRWADFREFPEIRGLLPGPDCDQMICRELLVAGDTGMILTNQRKLQLVEAEQIRKSMDIMSDGIDKGVGGKPLRYWVAPWHGGYLRASEAKPYKAGSEFLFIPGMRRPSSLRAVPPCQAAFPMLHRINDVCDSEAIAWQTLSRFALSVTREGGSKLAIGESSVDPTAASDGVNSLTADRVTNLGYALIFHGEPGDTIQSISRNIPGQNFETSVTMFMRLLGLPLGLPLEIILLDWTKSNYSQSRAVLEQAYTSFRTWQSRLRSFYYTPVYKWQVDLAVADGEIEDTPDKYAHEWILPTFPWIDLLKEAQAQGDKLDRCMTTHSRVLKGLGLERENVLAERTAEVESAIQAATALSAKYNVQVPWEIFCGLQPPAKKETATDATGEPDGSGKKPGKGKKKTQPDDGGDEQ